MSSSEKKRWSISTASVVIWTIVVLTLVLIVVMAIMKPPAEEFAEPEAQPVLVVTQEVVPQSRKDAIVLPARTEAHVSAVLALEKAGRITSIAVEKGDKVAKGQTLVEVDARQWKTGLDQARIELENATRDLVRWKKMQSEGAVSDSEFDAVKRRHDLAVTALESAELDFAKCTLRAPFDGVVDARMVEVGEFANEGQPAFRLVDVVPMKVTLSIPERDVAKLRLQQTLQVSVPALDGITFPAKIQFIASEASANTYSYPVELIVENPPENLLPGMIVNVELVRGTIDDAIIVPLASVIPQRGEHVVFVASNNLAERTVVKLQNISGQDAILSEGLEAGDALIVDGHRGLQDGVPIKLEGAGE
jgi:membrane fusion protein (multidrug efflux system)